MKPYGRKHPSKICQCVQCGKDSKAAHRSRARKDAKKEIKDEIRDLNKRRKKAV